MADRWAGRKVAQLVAATLHSKGTICHLCDLAGADSADHDPPRSVLVRLGVPNPDALEYLWPAHLSCNHWRNDRELTLELKQAARARRLKMLDRQRAELPLSPRFARRRR